MMTRARFTATVAAICVLSNGASAEIKDHEILRLLYLHTPCGMASVTSRQTSDAVVRFTADCQNRTAFPDGAVVACSDHNDDRSCKVQTEHRRFDSLELLKPKP